MLHPDSLAEALSGATNWCTAEVLRKRGEILLACEGEPSNSEAENLFLRSIDISRRQKALSWELRSATSLARLWQRTGRTVQARDLLSRVYERFTEGFARGDLVEAKALLNSLR